jgi:hypothetical protein
LWEGKKKEKEAKLLLSCNPATNLKLALYFSYRIWHCLQLKENHDKSDGYDQQHPELISSS